MSSMFFWVVFGYVLTALGDQFLDACAGRFKLLFVLHLGHRSYIFDVLNSVVFGVCADETHIYQLRSELYHYHQAKVVVLNVEHITLAAYSRCRHHIHPYDVGKL